MMAKLCMPCFRQLFGPDAKPRTLTWSRQCSQCLTPTPRLGLLVKADVVADMARG